jgi:hypothetical protein
MKFLAGPLATKDTVARTEKLAGFGGVSVGIMGSVRKVEYLGYYTRKLAHWRVWYVPEPRRLVQIIEHKGRLAGLDECGRVWSLP